MSISAMLGEPVKNELTDIFSVAPLILKLPEETAHHLLQ